ncbi:GHMP kinase [Acidianus sp. HS-5]|uniref:GHMP family kinase ATP-binding protein n=1 Tax=Acidianus sp. HS-5 TaxID=2886040 RepID=UPI001F40CF34|nr:GHMP kinase [Acidianus sp. HS-5]BDC18113.1 GHMP kinase [Acidianus sp. HS-5]
MLEIMVPLSISGVWYPVFSNNLENSGSVGLTMVLEPYSRVLIRRGDAEIIFNGKKINFPNLDFLKNKLGYLRLEIENSAPLGFGYGLSGSISLAYALGASEIFGINEKESVKIAHESEVISKNGLGDVISQYVGGGLVYRKTPGINGEIKTIKLDWRKVCSKPIEKLSTTSLLKNSENALSYIQDFLKEKTIDKFFEVSKKFTEELGFYSPYKKSFRKKGIIVRLDECEEEWIIHKPAMKGAYVV